MILATATLLMAASAHGPAEVTVVVRPDARTGRLVRAVTHNFSLAPKKDASRIEQPPVEEPAPAAFAGLVDGIADRNNVDRDLVHSVIRVESNYNPLAVSNKGALGLMQLVPSTARRFGVSNSFNPAQNVEGGVRYLKYLLDRYNGDHSLALAAYNAGEQAVERYGGVPPYPETRNYVNRVAKRFDFFKGATKAQAGADPASPLSSDGYNPIQVFTDRMGRICFKTP